jgi:uncharacterized protein YgbK (DUF1537 family)
MIEAPDPRQAAVHRSFVDRLVVLDDDPTGVQTLAGIRVLLDWSDPARIAGSFEAGPSVHLVTNVRALEPAAARRVVAEAARTAVRAVEDAHVVLRGDSTLRGHLLEEYLGLCDALGLGRPPLLLVPALPSAGRITRDGVHLIARNGRFEPLHDTEYAADGVFVYSSARLLDWAQERSRGLFPAAAGRELHLDELHARGAASVTEALRELSRAGRPAVLAPDAVTEDDLATIAAGYASALDAGVDAVVRCAPTFAGILAGSSADGLVPVPRASGATLVVCGSYVAMSTRQLAALAASYPGRVVEVDVTALAGSGSAGEEERAARAASVAIAEHGLAVLATPRERPPGTTELDLGRRIAEGLARTAGHVDPAPSLVVGKGGITSAVTLQVGFAVSEADVLGPVLPGVSYWRADRDGAVLDYLVVPGNVGDENLLVDLVRAVLGE